ncbi:hypothetical protein [Streptomyces sp. NPDC006638]|uniref:hypothetical protein n=1 Tax=Streptomyces sp. NPDC006638 TaxID=3157183 RepID=UPI0033AF3DFE
MLPPRPARSRVLIFGCSLVAVGYVTAFYLSSADGALLSARIAQQRLHRMSGYQWGTLAVEVLAVAAVLPALLAAPQFMEGGKWYWRVTGLLRTWQRRRRDWLRRQWARRRARIVRDIGLRRREWQTGTPADQAEATIRVDRLAEMLAVRYPTDNALVRASTVGNILSAARQHITEVYALDVLLTWPRLYPVLGRRLRSTSDWQRATLDAALSAWAFALLAALVVLPASLLWSPYDVTPWAAPMAVAAAARLATVRAAIRYATTVRVAFDLHRFDLYEALHLPAPGDLAQEQEANRALSRQWHPYGAVRVGHPARSVEERPEVVYGGLSEAGGRHSVAVGGNVIGNVGIIRGGPVLTVPAESSGLGAETGGPRRTRPRHPTTGLVIRDDGRGGERNKDKDADNDTDKDADNDTDVESASVRPDALPDKDEQEAEHLYQLASAARLGGTLIASGTVAAGALGVFLPGLGLGAFALAGVSALAAQALLFRKEGNQPAPEGTDTVPPPPLDYSHPAPGEVSLRIGDGTLRTALEPATPVAFRGGVAVTLENAADVGMVDGEPEWRLRPGEPANVVVLIGLGRNHQEAHEALLRERHGISDEMLIVAGRSAGAVELDIILDAPFLAVTPDRHSIRHDRTGESAVFRLASVLTGTEPGTYDVRVAVYAYGRPVQALPVTVVVMEPEDGGRGPRP